MLIFSRHGETAVFLSLENLLLCSFLSGTPAGGRKKKRRFTCRITKSDISVVRGPLDKPCSEFYFCECTASTSCQLWCNDNTILVVGPEHHQASLQHFVCGRVLPRQAWKTLKR